VERARDAAAKETGDAYPDRSKRLEDEVFMFEMRASAARFSEELHEDARLYAIDLFDDDTSATDVLAGAFSLVQCIQGLGHIETARVQHALIRMRTLLDDDGGSRGAALARPWTSVDGASAVTRTQRGPRSTSAQLS
jgi:hypothetical protein